MIRILLIFLSAWPCLAAEPMTFVTASGPVTLPATAEAAVMAAVTPVQAAGIRQELRRQTALAVLVDFDRLAMALREHVNNDGLTMEDRKAFLFDLAGVEKRWLFIVRRRALESTFPDAPSPTAPVKLKPKPKITSAAATKGRSTS